MTKPAPEEIKPNNSLKDKVILIINGLSESGRKLAIMLAEQGSDVAVVDFTHNPTLARRICRDVEAKGQRCLVLTSDTLVANKKPFLQTAMHRIIDTLGSLDTFISYSARDVTKLKNVLPGVTDQNGRLPRQKLFDDDGLTFMALRQIHAQTLGNE